MSFKTIIYFMGNWIFAFTEDLKFGALSTKMTEKHETFPLYVDIPKNVVKDKAYNPQIYVNKH